VQIAVIDNTGNPASSILVSAIQQLIAPLYSTTTQVYSAGLGYLITESEGIVTFAVNTASEIFLEWHMFVEGAGSAPVPLAQAGLWTLTVLLSSSLTSPPATDLATFGVYNNTTTSWAATSSDGTGVALMTVKANQIPSANGYAAFSVNFYWNGTDNLTAQLQRLDTATVGTLSLENMTVTSRFSRPDGSGLAPIGALVTVQPASALPINLVGTLSYALSYSQTAVQAAILASVTSYITSLAYSPSMSVKYAMILSIIMTTPGVTDCTGLTLNGGTSNITVGTTQVATVGSITVA
jgi:hypothetical protein